MKFLNRKNLIILIILVVIILLGMLFFQVTRLKEKEPTKIENYIPVGEARENFKSLQNNPALTGKFSSYDELKSEISILSFDTDAMRVISHAFKLNDHTIFSETTNEFDQSRLFSVERLKDIPAGTQFIVYYTDPENQAELPVAKLIQVEDFSQPLAPEPVPSLPE